MKKIFSNLQIKYSFYALRKIIDRAVGQNTNNITTPKILYVASNSFPYHANGYAIRTHEIIKALQRKSIDVHVLTRPGYPWKHKGLCCKNDGLLSHDYDNVIYHHMSYPRKLLSLNNFVKKAGYALAKYAKEHNISCIHAASNYVNALPALFAARVLGIPFHYEVRGVWELSRVAQDPNYQKSLAYARGLALEGFVCNEADKCFFISELLADYAKQNWNVTQEKVYLLPNCVQAKEIKENISVNRYSIAYAGALVEYEGLDILLHAVYNLVQLNTSIHVDIFGDGYAKHSLQALCSHLGLQAYVTFHGSVEKSLLEERLASCSLVCIPRKPVAVSLLVPPLKLVEAMALAKTVVVPDLPLFREEVGNAPVHFFKAGDVQSLACVLKETLESDIKEQGLQCRDYVLKYRQWDFWIEELRE